MPGFVLKDNGGEISSQSISTVPQRNMSQRPKEQNKSPQLTEQMGNYWWRRPQQSKNTVSKNHICWHIQCFYQIILGNTPTFWFKLIFTQCVRQWRLIKCFLLILQEAFLQCKRQWGGTVNQQMQIFEWLIFTNNFVVCLLKQPLVCIFSMSLCSNIISDSTATSTLWTVDSGIPLWFSVYFYISPLTSTASVFGAQSYKWKHMKWEYWFPTLWPSP